MVVVAMLAILTAIVYPKISFRTHSKQTAIENTLAMFRHAKERSVADQESITVSINVQSGTLKKMILVRGLESDEAIQEFVPDHEVIISFNKQVSAVIFSPTAAVQVKTSSGIETAGPPLYFYFSKEDAVPDLILFPNTGRIIRQR